MKNKALYAIVLIVIALAISYTFYKTFILGDFEIVNFESDPEDEQTLELPDGPEGLEQMDSSEGTEPLPI
jgi:hypothetical protein